MTKITNTFSINAATASSMFHAPRSMNKGTTLIEIIIYMGIFGIILIVLSNFFISTIEIKRESEAVSYTAQDVRFLLQRLTYDIKNATSITTPATLGAQGSVLIAVVNGVTNTYTLTGTNLTLNGIQLNGYNTNISNLSFQRLGNNGGKHSIKIALTVTGKVRKASGLEVAIVQTAVALR